MIRIDQYAYTSRWATVSPVEKSLLAVGTLVVCVCTASPWSHLLAGITMGLFTVVLGGVPLRYFLRMMILPAGFLLLGVLGIVVQFSDQPPPDFPYLALGELYLFVTPQGIRSALGLCLKSLSAVSCLYFLILSTPVRDINALLYRAGVPGILVEQLMLIYRFIFLLMDKATVKINSLRCRSGFRGVRSLPGTLGMLWGAVFVQSWHSAKAIYDAMRARGYDTPGKVLMLRPSAPARPLHMALVALYLLLIARVGFL